MAGVNIFFVFCIFILPSIHCLQLLIPDYPPFSQEMINHINGLKPNWTAGQNYHPEMDLNYIRRLCGDLTDQDKERLPTKHHRLGALRIPTEFDSRVKWPRCSSIQEIRDQGDCGSCWAFSAAEAMTDRYCIASKGNSQFRYSSENLMSCCWECGFGCKGGFPRAAWEYWKYIGIVSGGPYNSSSGCQPYEVPPCEHHISGPRPNCTEPVKTPKCIKTCESSYDVNYKQDLHYGKKVYSIARKPEQIQMEIMKNGPIQAAMWVYSDFPLYKSGVYHHVSGSYLGGHAVKILGWGEENGSPYWLVANSWNTDWGSDGFFKIQRGNNECGIEASIIAGIPAV